MKTLKQRMLQGLPLLVAGISLILSPVLLEFIFAIQNPNLSPYDLEILIKHVLKVSAPIFILAFLFHLPLFLSTGFVRKIFILFLILIAYVPSLLDLLHVVIFGVRLNASSVFTMLETERRESISFIKDYTSASLFFYFLLVSVMALALYYSLVKFLKEKTVIISGSIIVFVLITSCIFTVTRGDWKYVNECSVLKIKNAYTTYKREMVMFRGMSIKHATGAVQNSESDRGETIIVLIGESTGRHHMHLYGYERETTPRLDSMKKNMFVFSRIKSKFVHSAEALKDVLVLKDSCGHDSKFTLLDCFNDAGFKTFWISNQEVFGTYVSLSSAIAMHASEKLFASSGEFKSFDEVLLPPLETALGDTSKKKLIFLHLMGSHLSYEDRFPPTFQHFKEKSFSVFGSHADAFINSYDNSILYQDYLIAEVMQRAEQSKNPISVLYFSDHGDEVYDQRNFHGHAEGIVSRFMQDVPFLVYFNSSFSELKNARNIPSFLDTSSLGFTNQLQHTLQQIGGIHSAYFNKDKSLLKSDHNTSDNQDIINSNSSYTLNNTFFDFKDRIWAHRVNSTERLKALENQFSGLEFDLVFEQGKCDIFHPPASSIALHPDLYFSSIKDLKKHRFWVDLKNVNASNADQIGKELQRVCLKSGIQNSILLETEDATTITILKKYGFPVSLYLPELSNKNDEQRSETIQKINGQLAEYHPDAISQSIDTYLILKENFPEYPKLLWALGEDQGDTLRLKALLARDPLIKIILVNHNSIGWR